MQEEKGTTLTREDVIKGLQDAYNSMPNHFLNPPRVSWDEIKRIDELMRTQRFNEDDKK